MRKIKTRTLVPLLILMTLLLAALLVFQGHWSKTGFVSSKQADADPAAPVVSAETAILLEAHSGRILYEKRGDQKMFPASTTKVMTALLAVEAGEFDHMVKVSASAATQEGSSIYLTPGERVSRGDLIYGLMLRSGNDAAMALAEDLSGSKEAFAARMNQRAAELGAKNTSFLNPSGLHDQEHYTTARDLALISREAMKNQNFRTVVGARSYVAAREPGAYNYFYNKNKVLYQYEGGTGIKIGYTRVAGRCLVASSKREGMELICVVLNAPGWFQDTYALMDYGYRSYQLEHIARAEQPLKKVRLPGSSRFVAIGPKEAAVCPVDRGEEGDSQISVSYRLDPLQSGSVQRWQRAGVLQISYKGQLIYEEPLYFLEDAE